MSNYTAYEYLKRGSHIRILCTARTASKEKLKPAIDWLLSLGYRVTLGTTIGKQHHQYGGSNKERLIDFTEALTDVDVDAIWIARGGYGSVKIVDDIDMSVLKGNDKILMGYSDVTHLHGLWQRNGLQSMHTFMPQELAEKPGHVRQSWNDAATGKRQVFKMKNESLLDTVTITAPVVGGNLSVLASMLGSRTFPILDGAILFLEDLDEMLYHMDRLVTMLKRAGKLNKLAAIIVGGMTDMRDNDVPFGKTVREIIEEHTQGYDYPVIHNFSSGHMVNNLSVILGKEMKISIDPNTITISQ